MESGNFIVQNVVLIVGKTNKDMNSYYYNYHHNPTSKNTFSAEPLASVILSQEWIFYTVLLLLCFCVISTTFPPMGNNGSFVVFNKMGAF